MRDLSAEELQAVNGGLDFDGRRTSDNVIFRYSLDALIDEYGVAGGLTAWAAQNAGIAAGY